jgi:subfamily B ATP-binding cassette protein HlyB/CyaB
MSNFNLKLTSSYIFLHMDVNRMLLGKIAEVFFLMTMVMHSTQMLHILLPHVVQGLASLSRLLGVINLKSHKMISRGRQLSSIEGHIRFENVTFQYPARPDVTVIENISFEVLPQQSAALVGASGSGKSTIVSGT